MVINLSHAEEVCACVHLIFPVGASLMFHDQYFVEIDANSKNATFYKIKVQQFDELGNTQNTEIYYTNTNSISLAWHFSNKKSRFLFDISYTTDTSLVNNPPVSSTNALGQSYLDPTGNYNPIFVAANKINLANVNLGGGIIARAPPNVGGE